MAKVNLCNIVVLDNPSPFLNPLQFEITFECIDELKEDLEWKMIYVGSAESEAYDQVLDTIYVGPIPEGRHMFVFQADPPDVTKIPVNDVLGVTVVLLTCCYRSQEFVRVGYYTNNEYADAELRENPPMQPLFDKIVRNILGSQPRVTRFKINWEEANDTKERMEVAMQEAAAAEAATAAAGATDTGSSTSPPKSNHQNDPDWGADNSQNSIPKNFSF